MNPCRKQWDGDSYDTYRDLVTNQYGYGAAYALGAIVRSDTKAWRFGNDGDAPRSLDRQQLCLA